MGSKDYPLTGRRDVVVATLLFVSAAVVYGLYGFQGPLIRDDAMYAYGGQQVAEGVPPYVSIFDAKGPLAYLLAGVGVVAARALGSDDLVGIRVTFFLSSCLTVLAIYYLGKTLFRSRLAAAFSSLVFLGFDGFAKHAASGPRAKAPMVLLVTLSLLLTSRRMWFSAGLCGSLAFLCWQPTAVYPLITLVLAALAPSEERFRAISRTVAGILTPVSVTVLYFCWHGALFDLVDGTILFNIFFLQPTKFSLVLSVFDGYRLMAVPIFIGLLMNGYFYILRRSVYNNYLDTLTRDVFSPVLLSFPVPFIWSMLDYQRYPDFYVFLPYAAIGFGYFLYRAVSISDGNRSPRAVGATNRFLAAGVCCVLLLTASVNGWMGRERFNNGLSKQRHWAAELEARLGEDLRFLSIDVPQLLVLLNRRNPSRYIFIGRGIDRHIDARTVNGFQGWVQQLADYDPDIIALGSIEGEHVGELQSWLSSRYERIRVGPWWKLFAKR